MSDTPKRWAHLKYVSEDRSELDWKSIYAQNEVWRKWTKDWTRGIKEKILNSLEEEPKALFLFWLAKVRMIRRGVNHDDSSTLPPLAEAVNLWEDVEGQIILRAGRKGPYPKPLPESDSSEEPEEFLHWSLATIGQTWLNIQACIEGPEKKPGKGEEEGMGKMEAKKGEKGEWGRKAPELCVFQDRVMEELQETRRKGVLLPKSWVHHTASYVAHNGWGHSNPNRDLLSSYTSWQIFHDDKHGLYDKQAGGEVTHYAWERKDFEIDLERDAEAEETVYFNPSALSEAHRYMRGEIVDNFDLYDPFEGVGGYDSDEEMDG